MYNQNNNNQGNSNQNRYTDLNMKHCLTKGGSSYVGVTVKSVVTRPNQPRTYGDRRVIDFTMPINGRGKYIETMCEKAPYGKDGTVWAKVSFWQYANAADGPVSRLDRLFSQTQGKGVVLVVTGSIRVEESEGKDGRVFVNTNITGDDFCVVSPTEEKPNARYSFMNMKRCVGKNGNPYIGVTAEVAVFETDRRDTPSGRSVINFNTSLRGRSKYIETMCGMTPYTNDKGVTRVRGAFWEDANVERSTPASRLEHMLQKNPDKNFVLCVTGAIKVEQRKDDQGNVFVDTKISCDDFTVVRSFAKQQANGYDQSGQQKKSAPQGTDDGQQNQGYGRPEQESIPSGLNNDFYDIEDDDDELPF